MPSTWRPATLGGQRFCLEVGQQAHRERGLSDAARVRRGSRAASTATSGARPPPAAAPLDRGSTPAAPADRQRRAAARRQVGRAHRRTRLRCSSMPRSIRARCDAMPLRLPGAVAAVRPETRGTDRSDRIVLAETTAAECRRSTARVPAAWRARPRPRVLEQRVVPDAGMPRGERAAECAPCGPASRLLPRNSTGRAAEQVVEQPRQRLLPVDLRGIAVAVVLGVLAVGQDAIGLALEITVQLPQQVAVDVQRLRDAARLRAPDDVLELPAPLPRTPFPARDRSSSSAPDRWQAQATRGRPRPAAVP